MPKRQRQKGHRLGLILLVVLVAGVALAAGAWLGGWRPPAKWRVPAIGTFGESEPAEVIHETERRSLEQVLHERGSAKGN